jgi:Tfp pilus assembly protein PilF
MPTAAHFLYIPAVLLLGIVIGWILGSRAAADAYAVQLRKLNPKRSADSPITNHRDADTQRRSSN